MNTRNMQMEFVTRVFSQLPSHGYLYRPMVNAFSRYAENHSIDALQDASLGCSHAHALRIACACARAHLVELEIGEAGRPRPIRVAGVGAEAG